MHHAEQNVLENSLLQSPTEAGDGFGGDGPAMARPGPPWLPWRFGGSDNAASFHRPRIAWVGCPSALKMSKEAAQNRHASISIRIVIVRLLIN